MIVNDAEDGVARNTRWRDDYSTSETYPSFERKDKSKEPEHTVRHAVGILRNPEMEMPQEDPGTVLRQYTRRTGLTCFSGEAAADSQEEIPEQLEPVLKKFSIEIRKSSVPDLQELTKKEKCSSGDLSRDPKKDFMDSPNEASECWSAIEK